MIYAAFLITLLVYGGLNYYIGLRGLQAFATAVPFVHSRVYWPAFSLLAGSYLIGRMGERFLPGFLGKGLTIAGSYWLAAFVYLTLGLAALDFVRFMDRFLHFLPHGIRDNPNIAPITGAVFLAVLTGLMAYGTWNGLHPRINHYNISIDKKADNLGTLHVVMVSDIHLGNIVNGDRLAKMVDMINGLGPDIVLLAGDTIDEDVVPFKEQQMSEILCGLSPKFGSFAVLGNHEYYGGQVEQAVRHLQQGGIRVLRDETVKVADSFYIVGRDYRGAGRFTGQQRKELQVIMKGIDGSLPIILLDHEPVCLEEAKQAGVDLQLSGHTHKGQFFPNQLVTGMMFDIDWGYLRRENLQVIVSSGFGTWGPPIRIGNRPEIVDIMIHFDKN